MAHRVKKKPNLKQDAKDRQRNTLKDSRGWGNIKAYALWGLLIGLIGATVAGVHWPALSAQAVSLDDSEYLTNNALVQNPSWTSTGRFLSEVLTPSTVRGYYQPLSMISLMLDVALGGRPDYLRPFHRTSLALHVLNTTLVIVLLYLLFGQLWIAAMVGLLFGVHPLTVEPIPWVGERKTLLAAFFSLLSLLAYVRYCGSRIDFGELSRVANCEIKTNPKSAIRNSKLWYALCIGCYVLALLSKPTSTALPLLLVLLDFWPLGRIRSTPRVGHAPSAGEVSLRWAIAEKIPFFLIGLIFAIITYISQQRTAYVFDPGSHSSLRILFILCHNIIFYPYKMLWPAHLSSHYPFPVPMTLAQPMVLAGVIGTSLLIPLLLISLRWTRALLVGWLFFFLAIFPTLGVIGFTIVIASDKYAYLPFFGILMILAWLLGHIWAKGRIESRKSPIPRVSLCVVVLAAIACEAYATRKYLNVWQDTERLYRHMLELAPDECQPNYYVASILTDKGRFDEAIPYYRRALQLFPYYIDAHNNLGTLLLQQGQIDEAIEHFRAVIKLEPNDTDAMYNLGAALLHQGKIDEAMVHFNTVLKFKPDDIDTHNLLGKALLQTGKRDEAIDHFRKVLELNPGDTEARDNLNAAMSQRRN